jgi:hypothetical protein
MTILTPVTLTRKIPCTAANKSKKNYNLPTGVKPRVGSGSGFGSGSGSGSGLASKWKVGSASASKSASQHRKVCEM